MKMSLWAMGNVSLDVQQLGTLPRDQDKGELPKQVGCALWGALWVLTHLFGVKCLLSLCLDCPRSSVLSRAMPIIPMPAFLAASSSVFP